jgi:ornithine carbamoyltransferase
MPSKRDLLSVTDLSPDEISGIIRRAREMKAEGPPKPLRDKSAALLFEKPSLRTRASFQVGIQRLGGYSLYLGQEEVGLGTREPVSDVARVLSGYVDCIVARVFSHRHLVELAQYASVPVINALSDWEHPCQTLADLLTIDEHLSRLEGVKLAFIGDGNNVARSLCLALPALGASFAIAAPEGYDLDDASLDRARDRARAGSRPAEVLALTHPADAVRDADVVYTDVWASMGQEEEAARRNQAFRGYTVDPALLSQAKTGALFMHDMPAHYGEEVPPGMLEHPQSVAYKQAHNRLHAQMALLEFVFDQSGA